MEKTINTNELLGKVATRTIHSDQKIIGKIIGLFGKTGIIIEKIEFVPKGFTTISINDWSQSWQFKTKENTFIYLKIN